MLKRWMLPAVATLVLAGSVFGTGNDRKDIDALYAKLIAAMKAKSADGIIKLGTKDFTSKQGGMTFNAEQAKKQMEMQFKATKKVDKFEVKVLTCNIAGKTANVTTSYNMALKIVGQDGKLHSLTGTGKSKEVLVKTDKGWLFKSTEDTSSSMMMDGKPMPMPGAQPSKGKVKK